MRSRHANETQHLANRTDDIYERSHLPKRQLTTLLFQETVRGNLRPLLITNSLIFLGSILIFTSVLSSTAWADPPDIITHFDLKVAKLKNLQGMALDPQRNRLYLLNVREDGPELVDIEYGAMPHLNAKRRDLRSVVGKHSGPRCIAFNQQNSRLYRLNPGAEKIIELAKDGKRGARHEVLDLDSTDLKGCKFVPNSDRTDGDSVLVLFPGTGGSPSGELGPFPATLELSSLDGTNGFVLNGIGEEGSQSPLIGSSAGDINGDGIDDLIIGAPSADPNDVHNAGQSYVVFGTDEGFPPVLELSALDGTNGFVLNGIAGGDSSGISVSAAGDVNGDGINDLIIGAWNASPQGKRLAGQSYVVFGTGQGFLPALELSALDGTDGFAINGSAETDFSGISVSSAGDVNGDGIDDLIIGANGVDRDGLFNVGQSYVVFGARQGFPAALELSALDGSNGFALNGVGMDHFDNTGLSVSSAGDVNGDGIDDVVIGAPSAPIANRDTTGQSYVVFGTWQGFPPALDLSALDGSNGFVLNGVTDGDFSGRSVSSAGDINGDGVDDFIIGANGASPNGIPHAGQSYVVFGTEQGFLPALELSALDGTDGFAINGIAETDFSGISVSSAGDVNGDGVDDLIIGAPFASPDNENLLAGQSYVVFGTDGGFPAALELSTLDGTNGFALNGIAERNRSGWSVSSAGDVNGDGADDLIIGSNFSDPIDIDEPGQSQSYVVFGR